MTSTGDVRTAGEPAAGAGRLPRLGFLGLGWIGAHRFESIVKSGAAEVAVVADSNLDAARAAARRAPGAVAAGSLDDLLHANLDGVVIATPTALHAAQAASALDAGLAVFCQKPLGKNAAETRGVVGAARRADRLLAVDMSYRFVRAARRVHDLVKAGEIGDVYAVDLVFHNAYGPDKGWYYDPLLSGGGCVIDLGIHLVDLALWSLEFPLVERVSSRLFSGGKPLDPSRGAAPEDYAAARLDLATGAVVNLACSWRLPAGRDAVIRASFYGTEGGAALRNIGGSFYDFVSERFTGTSRAVLDEPPDDWGGRAAVAWTARLERDRRYDRSIETAGTVAEIVDAIYGRTEERPA